MKNIYECYKCKPSDNFQLINHDIARDTVVWMAPESGTHNVKNIVEQYPLGVVHFVLIPRKCELQGLLWQHLVSDKSEPNALGQAGINTILDEAYRYGVCLRL